MDSTKKNNNNEIDSCIYKKIEKKMVSLLGQHVVFVGPSAKAHYELPSRNMKQKLEQITSLTKVFTRDFREIKKNIT